MVIDWLTWFPPQRTHVAAEFCETPPEAVRCVETSPSRDQPGSEMPRNLSIEEQRLQPESLASYITRIAPWVSTLVLAGGLVLQGECF